MFTYKICIDQKMLKNYCHRIDLLRTFYRQKDLFCRHTSLLDMDCRNLNHNMYCVFRFDSLGMHGCIVHLCLGICPLDTHRCIRQRCSHFQIGTFHYYIFDTSQSRNMTTLKDKIYTTKQYSMEHTKACLCGGWDVGTCWIDLDTCRWHMHCRR